ncbi:S-layer homology domain-containing protein [Lutispora thermophila]|uniref:S-layer homology domain-containing protein n=1 Tax=Lutispora thermophila DSM 19022 TaxID=1122184 RepID=A0A1M6IPW2_9FIRM|nr:S-layer homology domain-containing protein [Lutispora thermophila]SHJ36467.1 S-layer homology domain-containing protein [Lutispora thermophila DSM 19022]
MRTKRIISMILIITLMFSFSASVYADSDSIAESLKNIMTNIKNIIKEVIKVFNDVEENDWFAENVSMLYKLGIINGKPQKDGTYIFDPTALVSKSEFTKMLVAAMKYNIVDGNTFNDIGYEKHWAKKYIETAVFEGIINREEEGENYWPNIPIKRKDMALMMFRALNLESSINESPFPDVDEGFITKLHEEYLIMGIPSSKSTIFKPDGLTTRAEAAAIISRMLEYKENPKEYKKKMQWNEVTEDGVPMRLYLMEIDGKTIEERREDLFTQLNYPSPPWKNYSYKYFNMSSEELAKYMYKTAKTYMGIEYNIDYRNIDETYEENIKDVISKNNWGKYIAYDIRDFKERKIMLKSVFYTAENLLFYSDGHFYLRGTLKFKYSEPTLKSYLESIKDINGNSLKADQWYEQDVDVQIGRDPARSSYIVVYKVKNLNNPKPI